MSTKKYKSIRVERESNGRFSILIDNKVVDSGVKFKDVTKKLDEYLDEKFLLREAE